MHRPRRKKELRPVATNVRACGIWRRDPEDNKGRIRVIGIGRDVVFDSRPTRLRRMFRDRGLPAQVCGKGSLFLAHLTAEELIDFRSLRGFSRTNPVYGELCHQMLQRGIVVSPRGVFGCLSTPMTESELDEFVEALDRSLAELALP